MTWGCLNEPTLRWNEELVSFELPFDVPRKKEVRFLLRWRLACKANAKLLPLIAVGVNTEIPTLARFDEVLPLILLVSLDKTELE